jgi:streptomycin 6-kinase
VKHSTIPVDPAGCAGYIVDVHGRAGVEWLARLPALIEAWAARWSLSIHRPFPNLSYNYVTPVTGPGRTPLVLKAGVPHGELWSEIDALRAFDGRGAVRLIDADREQGVLLLERVLPGDPLTTLVDDEALVNALAAVMRRLWRPLPPGHTFRTVADLARGLEKLRRTFDGGYGPFPPARIDRAQALFRELTAGNDHTLIHGDMNPGNVLRGGREPWLAIDPKGYAGNPLYDVATFLNDAPAGLSEDELRRVQERRVSLLAGALGVVQADILAWAEAHAVLSGWWSYEDHGAGWERVLALAAIYPGLGHRGN